MKYVFQLIVSKTRLVTVVCMVFITSQLVKMVMGAHLQRSDKVAIFFFLWYNSYLCNIMLWELLGSSMSLYCFDEFQHCEQRNATSMMREKWSVPRKYEKKSRPQKHWVVGVCVVCRTYTYDLIKCFKRSRYTRLRPNASKVKKIVSGYHL